MEYLCPCTFERERETERERGREKEGGKQSQELCCTVQ